MTDQPLTEQLDLDAIEARANAATDGPWTVELEQCDCSDGLCSHGTYVSAVYADGERRTEFSDFPDADWQFAIRARTDVPAMAAEIRRLRAELGDQRAYEQRLREQHDLDAQQIVSLRAYARELERPAVEKQRNEVRESYAGLIAQCREDRDYENAFDVECRLRDREEWWKAEDARTAPAASAPRTLTESEHNRAWHAIEGAAGEEGADPGTVLNAVLRALGLNPPAVETHVVADDSDDPEHVDDCPGCTAAP